LLSNPLWVINTRLILAGKKIQSEQNNSNPKSSLFLSIIKEEGIFAFWKGIVPSLILVSNPAIQYSLFEKLKAIIEKKTGGKLSPIYYFLLGALAKTIATFITYPYILIKSRLQMKTVDHEGSLKYNGTMDALIKIFKYEGILAFYQGMSTRLTSSVLNAALLFLLKEEITNFFFMLLKKK